MASLICEKYAARDVGTSSSGERSYTRTYLVSAAAGASEAAVLSAAGLPALGSLYEFDAYAALATKRAKETDGGIWEVTAEYTARPGENPEQKNPNPTLRPPEVSVAERAVQIVKEKDSDGKAIRNSAGDQFLNLPPEDDYLSVTTHTRYETSFTIEDQTNYLGAVNLDAFLGKPAGRVKCTGYRGEKRWIDSAYYWLVTRVFETVPDDWPGWETLMLDQGYQYLGPNGKPVLASTGGVYHDRLVMLDGAGGKLADNADPVFIGFIRYRSVNFAPLNISL